MPLCENGVRRGAAMTKLKLELWIDQKDKIISFAPVPDWSHQIFDSEQTMLERLDRFIMHGFRFQ